MKRNSKTDEPRVEASIPRSNTDLYLFGLICLVIGFFLGYFFHGSQNRSQPSVSGASPQSGTSIPAEPSSPTGGADFMQQASVLKMALQANPRDVTSLTHLGNLYYDHQRWTEAISYYERALEESPNNADIRTDMGTAYYYSGNPQHAVEEYQKVLGNSPTHHNALFNLGIVRLDGLKDPAGAIAAWEKLLRSNPPSAQAEQARAQIARAKQAATAAR